MALQAVCISARRAGAGLGVNNARMFVTTASLCRRRPPGGPLPNEEIESANIRKLEKYRSFNRYFKEAQEAQNKSVWWKTYKGYLEQEDPERGIEQVDIGFRHHRASRSKEVKERRQLLKERKKIPELERASRLRTLKVPLDEVEAVWQKTSGPLHIKRVAEHYGVFRDLFPMAYFLPLMPLKISYGDGSQVHFGNRLTPLEAGSFPNISFEAEEGSLWTLLLTCPDEHLQDNEGEYVHWLVGNIPGGAVQEGEELCHYLPPFPARGTGFHRYIFVLFKQEDSIDFCQEVRASPCHSLEDRTFKTVDFYRKYQDNLTPAGLAFFQSQWDQSVTATFHNTLGMKEPVFEFSWPPVYHPPQVRYPHRQPLRYLDRYRDGKEHTYGIY